MTSTDTHNIVSIDAMGGDHGPRAVIEGARLALRVRPELNFIFHGKENRLSRLLKKCPELKDVSQIEHADLVIEMDEKPSVALRRGRGKSTMWRGVESVKKQEAGFAVSAGNTGALMATSMFCLGRMKGFERPAIAALWPSIRAECIVLDVGATVGADAQQLRDFAILGSAMASAMYDLDLPSVGLLNVGVEEVKGIEEVKRAAELLKPLDQKILDYRGFVEGHDISKGSVDVIVTEGFSGNIALKVAEGTAHQVKDFFKAAITHDIWAKAGVLLARRSLTAMRSKMSPQNNNGGVFLGLNGIVIKSHGGSTAEGFSSAIQLGHDLARSGLMNTIQKAADQFSSVRETLENEKDNSELQSSSDKTDLSQPDKQMKKAENSEKVAVEAQKA